jgi:hypothetical protein
MNTNTELIYASALRYALGRRTYICSVVQEELAAHWNEFSETTQALLVVDITDYLIDCNGGLFKDPEDIVNSWSRLGKSLYVSLPETSKLYVRTRLDYECKPSLFPFNG